MFFLLVTTLFCFSSALPVHDENGALWYLWKFGHLERTTPDTVIGDESVSSAVREFQKLAGLTETGEWNSETIAMMNVPRCFPYGKGTKRPLDGFTYRIRKYPIRVGKVSQAGQEIAEAFKIWSDVTGMCFKDIGHVDIGIDFDTTENGDEKTSDNSFFPRYGGTAHFDKGGKQAINKNMGTPLIEIAEEKFGPSLDLTHVNKLWDLMAPYYKGFQPREEEVIRGPINAPDICRDASLDTITRTHDGSTYVFKGDFYWKVIYNVTADGYPRRIVDDWDGLEGNLDASFTGLGGKTYFFKGNRYWSFTNKRMDSGYPRPISSGFPGIPDHLDAALTWGSNGKPYFFKGSRYWRYDYGDHPPVKEGYPSPMTNWKGLPREGVDAAVLWENQVSYFFKGGYYYRYDDESDEVYKHYSYPASTAYEWFSCRRRR